MLSSEKFILSVSTLNGSHEITLAKRILLTTQEQILLKHKVFKEKKKISLRDATVGEFVSRKYKD